jgi:phosphoesterase RecJ-like protein
MFDRLADALLGSRCLAITTHVAPDGDGLGSAMALKIGLARRSVASEIVVAGSVARRYAVLDPDRAIRRFPADVDRKWLERFDTVAVLDSSDWSRIGPLGPAFPPAIRKVCIDHHVSNSNFADVNVALTEACATAEIVHDFVCGHLGVALDVAMALPIYVALSTETGGFAFSNTTSRCHRLAAACVDLGVRPAEVHRALHQSQPLAAVALAARALANLQVDPGGRLAWISLGLDDFRECQATADHVGGLIEHARCLEGVELAILMFEDEPRSVKVSFRSQTTVDVNALASRFGGGGHVRAAGALIRDELAVARERLVAGARAALRDLPPLAGAPAEGG